MPAHRQAQDSISKKKPQVLVEAKTAKGAVREISTSTLALFASFSVF